MSKQHLGRGCQGSAGIILCSLCHCRPWVCVRISCSSSLDLLSLLPSQHIHCGAQFAVGCAAPLPHFSHKTGSANYKKKGKMGLFVCWSSEVTAQFGCYRFVNNRTSLQDRNLAQEMLPALFPPLAVWSSFPCLEAGKGALCW